jgi:membrane protein
MTLKDLWELLQETWNAWSIHRAPRSGAALAYYTTFSLAPLLVIVIAVAALEFGQEAAQGKIVTEIQGVVDDHGSCYVSSTMNTSTVSTQKGKMRP